MNDYQTLVSLVASRGWAEDFFRLGVWLHVNKRWGASAACFARVVEMDPQSFQAWANLGGNLHLAGRSEEAIRALCHSLYLKCDEGPANLSLSQIFLTNGAPLTGLHHAELAVEHEPQAAVNRVNLAFAQAANGMWAEAWQNYEYRFSYKLPEFHTRPYRLWRGEEVDHLYIEGEQGVGDGIFALRWLEEAAARAWRVTLFVHGPLYALVDAMSLPKNVSVRPLPQTLPQADAWCPMLSLPVALEDPCPVMTAPYVIPSLPVAPIWASDRKQVGIVWAGSPDHEQSHHRDCPLAYFLRLAEVPGVQLHALQVGPAQQQLSDLGVYGIILDRSPELTNYLDTANVISGLDLVIAVDTSVVHLAGAMGKPVWMLMNERGRDYRWPVSGERTDWYRSLRIFRRGLADQWSDVMARVDAELRVF